MLMNKFKKIPHLTAVTKVQLSDADVKKLQ